MVGDAAGMITPLCGNGMAMAIHASKIGCDWVARYRNGEIDRATLERGYEKEWNKSFNGRLKMGRVVQQLLFGTPMASEIATGLISKIPPLRNFILKQTHGAPF